MRIYEKDGLIFLDMIKPSNLHVHWREIEQLMFTVPWTAKQFHYAMGMLNLKVPLTQPFDACDYNLLVMKKGVKINLSFMPYVALYLTDNTTVADIDAAAVLGHVLAGKLYPCGATTNSDTGVTDLRKMWPVFARMEEKDLPLSLHGEVTDPKVALWDRERVFVDTILIKIHEAFPQLRIILEHVSTKEGAQFVMDTPNNVGGTVATQYMLCNCNEVYLWPTRNCFPMINSPSDQEAVICLAINCEQAFAGTDSAPHPDANKFCDGAKGGCLTEPYAVSLYAEAFYLAEAVDDRFEQFMSVRGPKFYGLAVPEDIMTLVRKPIIIKENIQIGPDNMYMYATPFMAGETLRWQIDSIAQ